MRMGRRGRKRQLAVEDDYWGLILVEVGTVTTNGQAIATSEH
jgi:hypothetical protein